MLAEYTGMGLPHPCCVEYWTLLTVYPVTALAPWPALLEATVLDAMNAKPLAARATVPPHTRIRRDTLDMI